ncbi:hypothetical protein P7C70_g6231, partial [Phenoliferia sp. Uapishka_3]
MVPPLAHKSVTATDYHLATSLALLQTGQDTSHHLASILTTYSLRLRPCALNLTELEYLANGVEKALKVWISVREVETIDEGGRSFEAIAGYLDCCLALLCPPSARDDSYPFAHHNLLIRTLSLLAPLQIPSFLPFLNTLASPALLSLLAALSITPVLPTTTTGQNLALISFLNRCIIWGINDVIVRDLVEGIGSIVAGFEAGRVGEVVEERLLELIERAWQAIDIEKSSEGKREERDGVLWDKFKKTLWES